MTPERSSRSRILVAASLVVAGVLGLGAVSVAESLAAAQQSNFMGGNPEIMELSEIDDIDALVQTVVSHSGHTGAFDASATRTLLLRFPAGVRSNWHTHDDGQLLAVQSGIGLHQVRGEEIEAREPGESWWTASGVEHWHGAHPDEDVVQITIYSGEVNWMDPVTDDQYMAPSE